MWYIAVFAFYLLFIVWTCLKSLKNVESMSDFTTGGHRMGLFIGVGTSVATWVSVASVMGVPGYLYSSGVAAIIGWVAGWFFGTALIPIVAYKVRRPESPAKTFPKTLVTGTTRKILFHKSFMRVSRQVLGMRNFF
ncbi:hypothetical protein [Cytobacillus firmus]|nr:hypothetical protein [Cytobacillus firmus]MBG9654763.1 hypothetical protein [Cytobacillus firmus]MED1907968.1 hypothetical protein [Cytobacillus firmus]